MTTKQTGLDVSGGRVFGLDTLRLFALILVTWQHAASVLGEYAETQWRGISPGQTGVGIFCAISGYLAFHTTPRSTIDWFVRRLISIFPLYWVVTVLAFAMVLIVGTSKPVTIWLFVSQMLGFGYFTHGWELVNVVSWFISLIFLCYTLSFLARKLGNPSAFWLVVVVLTTISAITRTEVVLSRHVLTFALGALYGMQTGRLWLTSATVVLIGTGVFLDPQLFYAGFGLALLGLAAKGWVCQPPFVQLLAAYSYEYFLVHGICLVAATKFIHSAPISVFVAIAVASASAVSLQYLDRYMQSFFKRAH